MKPSSPSTSTLDDKRRRAAELSHPCGILGVNHPEDLRGLAL